MASCILSLRLTYVQFKFQECLREWRHPLQNIFGVFFLLDCMSKQLPLRHYFCHPARSLCQLLPESVPWMGHPSQASPGDSSGAQARCREGQRFTSCAGASGAEAPAGGSALPPVRCR